MRALVLIAVFGLTACSSAKYGHCNRVCGREARCAAELELDMDEAECIAECSALAREGHLVRFVDQHARCVDDAPNCLAVLQCR